MIWIAGSISLGALLAYVLIAVATVKRDRCAAGRREKAFGLASDGHITPTVSKASETQRHGEA